MLAALPAPRDAQGMWLSLSRNQRLTLGMVAISAVVVLIAFITMSRPAEYKVAFSNRTDEETAAIVAKLKEAKIPYELAERGTIKVPAAQAEEVKIMVAGSGVLKAGGGNGFEIFLQPHFGLTQFAEKINYQYALEGELSRSVGKLDAVENAKVHVTLPEQSLFVSQKKDPTAAAVIQLKAGRRLDEAQVQGVVQLITGSVEGLKADAVTVMDTAGNILSQQGAASDPTRKQNTRVDIQKTLEQRLTDEVRAMLTPVVGSDKSVVRVNADLDWDQYESNAETFSPSQKAPQVRSRREISESNAQGASPAAGGVPGSERNLPGYPAVGASQNGNAQADKRDVTTNYELSRTTEKTVRTPGAIRRLNVAVALDSEVIADPAQAEAISRLVATAAGVDTSRGDLVTLTSLPFSPATAKPAEIAEQARQRETMLSLARMAAMVIGPLLVVGMIWLVLRRSRPKAEKLSIKDVTGDTQTADGVVALTAEEQLAALPKPEIDPEQARIEKELVRIAKNDPAMMATLIRTWMAEDKMQKAG